MFSCPMSLHWDGSTSVSPWITYGRRIDALNRGPFGRCMDHITLSVLFFPFREVTPNVQRRGLTELRAALRPTPDWLSGRASGFSFHVIELGQKEQLSATPQEQMTQLTARHGLGFGKERA